MPRTSKLYYFRNTTQIKSTFPYCMHTISNDSDNKLTLTAPTNGIEITSFGSFVVPSIHPLQTEITFNNLELERIGVWPAVGIVVNGENGPTGIVVYKDGASSLKLGKFEFIPQTLTNLESSTPTLGTDDELLLRLKTYREIDSDNLPVLRSIIEVVLNSTEVMTHAFDHGDARMLGDIYPIAMTYGASGNAVHIGELIVDMGGV